MPPPLPVRTNRRPDSSPTEPAALTESDGRRARRRSESRARAGDTGVLVGLAATCVVGFFVVIAGVIYLLWPGSSRSTAAVTQGPTPAVQTPVADEPPKRLEDIVRDAPPRAGNAGGPPEFPGLNRRPFGPPGPGVMMPGEGPGFPMVPPLAPPRLGGDGPRFAAVVPLRLGPARFAGDRTEVALPGPVESVAVAGGGRLLLLHSPASQKVFVFDVSAARVTREIDVPDPGALIAGGMNLFVIYRPDSKVIERWSCEKLRREAEVRQPFADTVRALAMGSGTNGPLAVAMAGNRKTFDGGCTLGYFDPSTMKEVRYVPAGMQPGFGIGNHRSSAQVRVSTDGRTVTGWGPGVITGAESNRLGGGQVTRHWHPRAPRPLLPAPDGQTLFGPGQIVPSDLPGLRPLPNKLEAQFHLVPAVSGDWYVKVPVDGLEGRRKPPVEIGICRVGNPRPMASLPPDDTDVSRAEHGMDQSVILVPDARVLFTVAGPKRTTLVLRRVDLK